MLSISVLSSILIVNRELNCSIYSKIKYQVHILMANIFIITSSTATNYLTIKLIFIIPNQMTKIIELVSYYCLT